MDQNVEGLDRGADVVRHGICALEKVVQLRQVDRCRLGDFDLEVVGITTGLTAGLGERDLRGDTNNTDNSLVTWTMPNLITSRHTQLLYQV